MMKRLFSLAKFLIRIIPQVAVLLLLLMISVVLLHRHYEPEMKQLRAKDPYRFQRMTEEAQNLHWINAWNQLEELRQITLAQVYQERYERWLQRWDSDAEFRRSQMRLRGEAHQQVKESQKKKYGQEIQELNRLAEKPDLNILHVAWEQASPWQKSLMLRDHCVHYLSMELADFRKRRSVRDSLQGAARLAQSRIANVPPGELCREMVPLVHDTASVTRSLKTLREEMNYYYFVRLLADIGVPDSEVFTLNRKLEGMTRDFGGI
ncbi:MAG: hypothetical protein GWM98_06710 [Nitrospinaceae bacterium]|nr:hypothetical protein [Nitrospinaceae bacterium]NIR54245.1 hypothetical protein [Nitrospinaceae bacterium]NIS84662.1 hypothetical protein [Nitrospinaceae bacterium]NIT81457.1 hypothetical protein [Nitrospinaceae bacterium]NIU43741.1 hypothetical protein [Nitrospinaceae bacterium]